MHINLERVIKDLETMATFTATPGNGVTRLAYTKEDRLAKSYLISEMEKIGLKVWEDGFGTLFGRREGRNPNAPVVMMGSHYDSVHNAGAFDGVVGVVAALEILRVLEENDVDNYFPIELFAANAEEGRRFGINTGVANSRALVGRMTEEELDSAKDVDGISKREAMKEYGLIPDLEAAKREKGSIKNFIELHVEQGPFLEDNGIDIGIIESFPGAGRYIVEFQGKMDNSAAAMAGRRDALIAASKFVLAVEQIAKEIGEGITATTCTVKTSPNMYAYMTESVELFVETRIVDAAVLNVDIMEMFNKAIKPIEEETGVEIKIREHIRIGYPHPSPPSVMCENNNILIKEISDKLGYTATTISSGTGHDAIIMAEFAPTNLILVPSKDGLSHHPDEWTDDEDLKKGIDVMLHLIEKLSCEE